MGRSQVQCARTTDICLLVVQGACTNFEYSASRYCCQLEFLVLVKRLQLSIEIVSVSDIPNIPASSLRPVLVIARKIGIAFHTQEQWNCARTIENGQHYDLVQNLLFCHSGLKLMSNPRRFDRVWRENNTHVFTATDTLFYFPQYGVANLYLIPIKPNIYAQSLQISSQLLDKGLVNGAVTNKY